MNPHTFLFFFSLALFGDQIASALLPGRLWFAPLVLIVLMAADKQLINHFWLVVVCALIADIYSGLNFGYLAIGLTGVAFGVVVLRRWVRM